MPITDGQFEIIAVKQHTLTMDKSGVPKTVLMDRARLALFKITKAAVEKERGINKSRVGSRK